VGSPVRRAPTYLTVRKDLRALFSHYNKCRKSHSGFQPLRYTRTRFYSIKPRFFAASQHHGAKKYLLQSATSETAPII
jgi:hypothetical protein